MNYSLRLSGFLIVSFLSTPLDAAHASRETVLKTQVLLSLKGLYHGHIDGINGPQTKTAILLYEQQHSFPKTGQASAGLIEQLRMEIGPTVKDSSPKSNEQNSSKAESENDTNKKIEALSRDLNYTQSHLVKTSSSAEGIQKSLTRHFIGGFIALVSLLIAVIAIIVGVLTTIGVRWFDKKYEAAKEEIKVKVENSHRQMIKHSENYIGARLLATFGAHCIELYKDFDPFDPLKEKHRELYESYLNIAISLSLHAYEKARELEQEGISLTDVEKWVVNVCVNNKLFYLATRASDEDKEEAQEIFKQMEKTSLSYEADSKNNWWSWKETIAWAKFNLGYDGGLQEAQKMVQSLFNDPRVPREWKEDTYKRYLKHQTRNGEKLSLLWPNKSS